MDMRITTLQIAVAAVCGGLSIALSYTPIGFISVPNISGAATTLHIPAIVAGVVAGPGGGGPARLFVGPFVLGPVWRDLHAVCGRQAAGSPGGRFPAPDTHRRGRLLRLPGAAGQCGGHSGGTAGHKRQHRWRVRDSAPLRHLRLSDGCGAHHPAELPVRSPLRRSGAESGLRRTGAHAPVGGSALMNLLLALVVNNTQIKIGLYQGADLLHHWRVATDREKTDD